MSDQLILDSDQCCERFCLVISQPGCLRLLSQVLAWTVRQWSGDNILLSVPTTARTLVPPLSLLALEKVQRTINCKAKCVPAPTAEKAVAVVAQQSCLDLLRALKFDAICPQQGIDPWTS